jgi:hypothetical protein
MIIWGPELTMMHQVIGALQWHIVLMVQGSYSMFAVHTLVRNVQVFCTLFIFSFLCVDYFLVGLARMVNHTWWNGMRVKVL